MVSYNTSFRNICLCVVLKVRWKKTAHKNTILLPVELKNIKMNNGLMSLYRYIIYIYIYIYNIYISIFFYIAERDRFDYDLRSMAEKS